MFITEKLQVCFILSEVCTTVTAKTLGTSDQRTSQSDNNVSIQLDLINKMTVTFIFLIAILEIKGNDCQSVFGSVFQMGKLVNLERDIYSMLKGHASDLDTAVRDIEDYVKEVSGVYRECGDREECGDEDTERILGNPIHNYQLLKRLTVTWKKVQKSIKAIDGKSILSKIKKKKKREQLPTDADLSFAAKSLNNLKEVYKIPAGDLTQGNLLGVKTGARLGEQDLFYLASTAANQNNHNVAVDLLEHSAQIFVQKNTSSDDVNLRKVTVLLNKEKRKLPEKIKDETIVLGQVPRKTTDFSKLTTHQDKVNYEALCRGDNILPHHVTKSLTCFYSTR